ncbi:energy-coupling factor transporter transmembrane protein EcfT [Arthrobacter sp. I2-34]|uniref:Energy-coupling factor transporter transmembrane protein EcfT n=1 Tax=Arthrobacter hankyongi TaxID=2904801 RepID=A0ABS9LBV1_9MICC|nr:energy-coupling factor transporter transmembrane component T [Arthrobacter hankyongi]MCG2624158.1 energy-coupling factor transporter transmembrane protein EcfT [Arthrobacter hankyongi]
MTALHPFTGLALAASTVAVTLAANRWWLSLAVAAAALAAAALAGTARRLAALAAAVLAPLWLSQLMVHALFDRAGSRELFAAGPVRLTAEGLAAAGGLGLRTAAFVLVVLLYSLTVDRAALIRALDAAGVPAQFGYIVAATLALVPATADRLRAIGQAQAIRGTGGRGAAARLRSARLRAVPLVLASIQDAAERSVHLQLRGFPGGRNRTQYRSVAFPRSERVLCVLVLSAAAAAVVFLALPWGA